MATLALCLFALTIVHHVTRVFASKLWFEQLAYLGAKKVSLMFWASIPTNLLIAVYFPTVFCVLAITHLAFSEYQLRLAQAR